MQPIYNFYQLYAAELTLGSGVVALLLLLWVIALQWRLSRLHRRYRAAMAGVESTDLEAWLAEQRAAQTQHGARLEALERHAQALGVKVAAQAGHLGVVRFNAFEDTGSDQSFTIAWVDDAATGVVLTSLHSRAGTRIYAKPVAQGASAYTLTNEEQSAIQQASAR